MNNKCIADDVSLGKDVFLSNFINLYGCTIGDETKIGAFVEIQKNAFIGKRCKISSHSFICEGVHIADYCFVGHGVVFINDIFPRATKPDGSMQTDRDWKVIETHVEEYASIGSNVTVMGGVRIGRGAIVGAGSVVTKDIPPGEIWCGNPAGFLKVVE
jgi:acetyltransferase-like isoleucine patch superfamily enzyme